MPGSSIIHPGSCGSPRSSREEEDAIARHATAEPVDACSVERRPVQTARPDDSSRRGSLLCIWHNPCSSVHSLAEGRHHCALPGASRASSRKNHSRLGHFHQWQSARITPTLARRVTTFKPSSPRLPRSPHKPLLKTRKLWQRRKVRAQSPQNHLAPGCALVPGSLAGRVSPKAD